MIMIDELERILKNMVII